MKNNERTLKPGHQVFHVEDIRGGKYQKPNWDPICFYPEEERGIIYPHNDPLIVEAHIANFDVRRILVGTGVSVNIMFAEAFKTLNVVEHLLDHSVSPLISFSGDVVQPLGSVHLPFTIGTGPYTATITTNFLVVDYPTTYNVIFGCTGINDLKAMEAQPVEELEKVSILKDYPDRIVKINTTLSLPIRLALISFLQENTEAFAWSYEDIPGISPDIICHCLSIDPKTKSVTEAKIL
ncbi:uncharacterized protein [Pyrus communis]|uniref:uncharacterized protein n=1 Tax=Pyrus communis TaxID=23211 RepID=UPI0035BFB641